jgi:chromate reductase, NAD(P)H dehydrogenase (quinone)
MAKVLVFSGSNSSTSINQQLAIYAASFLEKIETKVIHLKDYEAPVYSMDMEKRGEFPQSMRELNELFKEVDAMLIALPEYNSGITPVFKNAMDWISRLEKPTLKNKPVCLLATSAGKRGAKTNLAHVAEVLLPRWGGELTSTFSLPNFDEHLVDGEVHLKGEKKKELKETLKVFKKHWEEGH